VEQVRGIQEQRVVSTVHLRVQLPSGRDGEARTDPQVTWRKVQMFPAAFRRGFRAGAPVDVVL